MKILPLLVLVLFAGVAIGQDKPLSNDERGKFIYYEVVSLRDVSAEALNTRAAGFLNSATKAFKITAESDSAIQAGGKMVIHKTALVLSRPSGEVKYNFYAETRDGKYRFWLTDFEFIPYQRDRYGNFVASTNIGTPLERKPGKLNAAEWAGYIKATTREANLLAARFKSAMADSTAANGLAVKNTPVISTQKW
ncbi:hypothetical protein ABIE26_004082 [Pedobacter africanus]|uniref:Uncharacterized protein n=1 Tax=Pedobacter africanus TaxID=151894 RepID=A0ACC6L1Q7_9SPHI|nr:DUF4468 domain-containing protein [Pedobacter africanus]MDR6785372.1 hypothetical protein [Pedobacter africanus]